MIIYDQKPWLKFYGDVPVSIDYPRVTMVEALMQSVQRNPDTIAYDFMDYSSTYKQFARDIDQCAAALAAEGLKQGDCLTIALPTIPQGVIAFYAVNKIGAVASMIHPLSTAREIAFYLTLSKSRMALILEDHYAKFKEVEKETGLQALIVTGAADSINSAAGKPLPAEPADPMVKSWRRLMAGSYPPVPQSTMGPDDMAAILYSGGTTGQPKGIMLSNYNFISEGLMTAAFRKITHGDKHMVMVASLPIFHGFGLGICCNAMFISGGTSILVPTFTPDTLAEIILKKKPTAISGVPTLYDALIRSPLLEKADLGCLLSATVGADTLPRTVKERFEDIVRRRGGSVQLVEGYGLTEAVTGIMLTPANAYREGSVGIPCPDMEAKIVRSGTQETVPAGEEGELCISGPAVMMGYLEQPEETAKTLQRHADGKIWLHTGDIFSMSEEGFFYFKLRLKRMIKSSGMNVYPAQVEAVLYLHPDVRDACVIGVPDKAQIERVKAFVVLKDAAKATPSMIEELIRHCREHLIKWSCPREVEFRDSLPLTRVGKIAFTVLEQEEIAKLKAAGKYTGE
ncbi:MAG: Acyl-CoA synthetases (AMP-forming)/AMP-acid ligases II [Syntrophaceae bacterium]|nr:MAG: Acyl-CoA synthetases (AMP-forming)/AMP-acid ligases II [Syntrophaceae bacterium]